MEYLCCTLYSHIVFCSQFDFMDLYHLRVSPRVSTEAAAAGAAAGGEVEGYLGGCSQNDVAPIMFVWVMQNPGLPVQHQRH